MNSERTKLLIGEEKIGLLKTKSILVVGVGGVGGYVCELLTRAGIGSITIVDFDTIDETNLNRQIIALENNIGKNKVDEFKKRLLLINSSLNIISISKKLDKSTIDDIFTDKYDYVVDAIDDLPNKTLLIKYCKDNRIPIVSALGTGNRVGIPNFEVTDIYKTENDGLAKKVRKSLRELGVSSLDVVYSKQNSVKSNSSIVGSISYFPAMCGCVLTAFVLKKIMEEK